MEEKYGVRCNSPKGCLREAYKQKIIEYDDFWMELTDWRNETIHIYNEEMAEQLYEKLPNTLGYFKKVLGGIKSE